MTGVLIKEKRVTKAGDTLGEHHARVKGRTDAVMSQQTVRIACNHLKLERRKEGLPSSLWRDCVYTSILDFWSLNCERTNFYCYKPPSV